MTKKEWLNELCFVDIYGRSENLSDVPMTYMIRSEVFKKRNYDKKTMDGMWKIYLRYIKNKKKTRDKV